MLTLLRSFTGKYYFIRDSNGVEIKCTKADLKNLVKDIKNSFIRWDKILK